MSRSLVIVESPAKAKTINKYLGNDFIVKSSIGHIRDLPTGGQGEVDTKARAEQAARTRKMSDAEKVVYKKKKAGEQLVSRMGIDPENGWKARYEILPGKEKVIDELRKLAKTADIIYLATDLDREGEAIAWHLREAIGGAPERYRRVVFNEITKKAIQQAFENPGQVDMDKVSAQQARRFLDRVVGFMVSPLLWAKVARGLSAGRVQSVSVRLIVEREAAIRAFIPDEYWEVDADLKTPKGATVPFSVKKIGDKAFRPVNQAGADAAVVAIKGAPLLVTNREDKPTSTKPLAPFITSTLQQAGSNRLGFSVKKTMMLAQRLYEAGYITYMRTDSTNLSADAVEACRAYIDKNYGKKYLPQKPNSYSSKENAQEAHEAVRPSNVALATKDLVGMEPDALRVYQLIWQQFVACQMVPAEFTSTRVDIKVGEYELRTSGRVVVFDGFQRVLPPVVKQDEDRELPDMRVNDRMTLVSITPSQHFTNPPPRFTEASLVKEMEKRGIGRPSTYAAIISTIQERGYVALKNRRFYAEKMGDIVTERLTESFSDLMDYGFTAGMEETLDEIASGKKSWKGELDRFYRGFTQQLEKAQGVKGGMRENNPVDTDIPCPSCGRKMQIRTGSTGVFLGCSGYGLPPKERCKSTINLVPGEEAITNARNDEEAETLSLKSKHRCKLCNTAMDSYLIDETRKLHICGRNPDCAGVEVEQGSYRLKGYEGPIVECDKCGSNMQLKNGRFGKYFGCTNEACRNTRKLMRNGEAAPPKMDVVPMPELRCNKVDDHYLLRDGASGLFLAASQFPKNREIRAPLVSELLPHRKEIDPKYAYLFDAPQKDPQGHSAVVRFSRKAQQQYVQTEIDGKPTGWRATYRDGRWIAEQGPAGKDDDVPAPRAVKSATAAATTKTATVKPKTMATPKTKAVAKPKAKAKAKTKR